MAPIYTPWQGWSTIFPGSIERGPIPSHIIMFGPIFLFGAQLIYARYLFQKQKNSISKFYSTLILLNIIAMICVTGPSSLSGLVQGFLRSFNASSYPRIPMGIWTLTIAGFAFFHSVNNCCRILFDAYGLRCTICFIPFAIMMQLWQVFALPFGFNPYRGFIVLTVIDYLQHMTALTYWCYKLCNCGRASDEIDTRRIQFGIGGVICHMISVIPQVLYGYLIDFENQTTVGLSMVYLATLILMFTSQCFWILMALRTPPRERIFVTDFIVAEDYGKASEDEENTIDEV